MKSFILRTVIFCLGLMILYSLIYYSRDRYLNSAFNKKDVIFIWGDSQCYRGIDIREMSTRLNKTVFSSAHSGAGVYDFLLFTQQVPENSEVIVTISKLVQIRRKEKDFNRSGLSFYALKKLSENDYTANEIISILSDNIKPKKNINQKIDLFPYRDSMIIALPISHFKSYYADIPNFIDDKQNLYLEGIANLIGKNCKISFLEFPYHPILENIERQSPIQHRTEKLKQQVASLFVRFEIDSIELNRDQNIFNDLSHLNCLGACDLSKKLGTKMKNNERTTLYIAH